MKTCPTCGGCGEVRSPGWYWVQLNEFGSWSDYLDFKTLDEAIACAVETHWGEKVRVKHKRKIVWTGGKAEVSHA